jgi:hypothetical protein
MLKEIMTRKMSQAIKLCNPDETNRTLCMVRYASFSTVSSVALQLQRLLVAF